MAIVINSLTPVNPVAQSGTSITFTVDATDTGGASLSYEWQFSQDGNTYTSGGLVNNTSSVYTTSNLTVNQNGLYFRVAISDGTSTIFSNEYPGIGNRIITVTQDPSIVALVDPTVDFYPLSLVATVGQSVSFTASASLADADISNTSLVSNINIQWQYSDDDGQNWIDIAVGGNVTVTSTVASFSTTPVTYYKYSTLQIDNITFDYNLYLYRARISFDGATNTPVTLSDILLLIDPQINIYRNPGEGNDTQQFACYKTSDLTSGKIKLQVGALSTANTTLQFQWEFSLNNGEFWNPVDILIQNYNCILKPGTTSDSDILELERFIFYDPIDVRCVISGTSGEATVISDVHRLYATDVPVSPILPSTTFNIIEDKYGDVVDRDIYLEPKQTVVLNGFLDTYRNTGLNGDVSLIYQRQNPGSLDWNDIGDSVSSFTEDNLITYVSIPSNISSEFVEIEYSSVPLRVSSDNGAKYRIKVTSTSLFTLSGNTKTLTPYYSDEITLNVYRTIYILNQPSDTSVTANSNVSFGVSATVSSGNDSEISYVWQYNTQDSNTGWVNIPNSSPYSGVNTSTLLITNVPVLPTYRFFRCVMSVSNQLSSVTTTVARLSVTRDLFTFIPSINDFYLNEFDILGWTVDASSISNRPITYQWQKSTDYNPFSQVGTWNDIPGENTNSYQILSVAETDAGYYRVRMTTAGGEVVNSNAAIVVVTNVDIILSENIPTSITVTEGVGNAYLFSCNAISTLGDEISYQWQIRRSTDSDFVNIGSGFNESLDNTRQYSPRAFDRIFDNGCKIRCKISSQSVPFDVFTNECTVNVNRVFTYFADVATRSVTNGSSISLDLNASWTGGTPSFSWEVSTNGGASFTALNETAELLFIPIVDSSFNNRIYRCLVTLQECNKHTYTRGNVTSTVDVNINGAYTLNVTISVVAASTKASYYSLERQKTGAAIGTVICVAKPGDYVNDNSATTDDVNRWQVAISGSLNTSNATSVVTSGGVYNANKPVWVTDPSYTAPKWELSRDRFKGYLEMRGQYLRAVDFPELARLFGSTYGGNVPDDAYPNYSTNHIFRMPNLYAKRLLGTGNVDNNRGAVSITPEYGPDLLSGGDKNVPGTIGGRYNYTTSSQLPPGSPGISGQPDGTAGNGVDPIIYSLGSFTTSGIDEASAFVQPTFAGTVTYSTPAPAEEFTDTPVHSHRGVSVAFVERAAAVTSGDCRRTTAGLAGDRFPPTRQNNGTIQNGPFNAGRPHGHGVDDQGPGFFDMVADAGMSISDTNIVLSGQSTQVFNNNLQFFLRNNSDIPLNSPYFRLKYLIKAY